VAADPNRPEALCGRIFRGRAAVEAGLLTIRQLRSRAWRRLFQGVYADSRVVINHATRCAVAVGFVLPPDSVIAGRSAAKLYGADARDADDAVEALVPRAAAVIPHSGTIMHRGNLAPEDRLQREHYALTTPVRTCWDLARWLSPVEAVVIIDQLLARGVVTPAQLEAYRLRRRAEKPTPRGIRRYERVLELVDGGAGSPQESRVRVRLVLAGIPRPETQCVVRDRAGKVVARVDLGWREQRLAVEYDGFGHVGSFARMGKDRQRHNDINDAGWNVVYVTEAHLREDFERIVAQVRAGLRRRRT
jgi:hypothetical protein